MSWHEYSLGEVCNIARGGSPRPIDKFFTTDDDGINWVKISDATRSKKYIFQTNEKIIKEGINRSRLVKDGDFLLSNSMSFGRPYIMRTTGCIHDGWLVLSDYEKLIDINFFYYLLSSPVVFNQFEKLAQGSTVRNLNKELVSRVKVKLPSLATQQKIVEKLDAIFADIDRATVATQVNVKNAEALFQSYLTEVFERGGDGWVKNKLSTICSKIGSGATPRGGNESYKSEGISLIRSMNVYDDGFLYDSLAHIDEEQARALDNVTVESDDVLFNITGASVARCCVVPNDVLPARVNQHVSILRAINEKINPNLLHLLLISKFHKNNLLKVGESGGTTRQAITKSQLIDYEISYPQELKSQKELVQSIQEFKSVTNLLKRASVEKLNSFHPMKQSILKQAFNGELVKE